MIWFVDHDFNKPKWIKCFSIWLRSLPTIVLFYHNDFTSTDVDNILNKFVVICHFFIEKHTLSLSFCVTHMVVQCVSINFIILIKDLLLPGYPIAQGKKSHVTNIMQSSILWNNLNLFRFEAILPRFTFCPSWCDILS